MDALPQEVYDLVADLFAESQDDRQRKISAACPAAPDDCSYAPSSRDLSRLAAASRQWQAAVERKSFRRLLVKSTELDTFKQLLASHGRRLCLREIAYHIILPAYEYEAVDRYERAADRLANDECFTAAIHGLFGILAAWRGSVFPGSVRLVIVAVSSPTDPLPGTPRAKHGLSDASQSPGRVFLGSERFRYSYLQLLEPDALPAVPAIGHFETGAFSAEKRRLSYRAHLDITAKLPRLRHTLWHLSDYEKRFPAVRRQQRDALAQRLPAVLAAASALSKLSVCMHHREPQNHVWNPADLRPSGVELDPVSAAIHTATAGHPSLEHLHVYGAVDSSLFTGGAHPGRPIAQPFWQNLRSLSVQLCTTSPSGEWYFCAPGGSAGSLSTGGAQAGASPDAMPPGHGHTEADDERMASQFSVLADQKASGGNRHIVRTEPDEERLSPLVRAFAQACVQIPRLEAALCDVHSLTYSEETQAHHPYMRGVYFFAPGIRATDHGLFNPLFHKDETRWRLLWVDDWPLSDDIKDTFRRIRWERHRGDLLEDRIEVFAKSTLPRYWERRRQQEERLRQQQLEQQSVADQPSGGSSD